MHHRQSIEAASIVVDIASQQLIWTCANHDTRIYPVSTALHGVGEIENSGCTPRGQHIISHKFGDKHPINSVFVGRVATGEIYTPELALAQPMRDWILTRILWLQGCEQGVNQGHNTLGQCCDSQSRYIYIHGTPDTEPMGVPLSHGCIRMRNADVLALFEVVDVGTGVCIVESVN